MTVSTRPRADLARDRLFRCKAAVFAAAAKTAEFKSLRDRGLPFD